MKNAVRLAPRISAIIAHIKAHRERFAARHPASPMPAPAIAVPTKPEAVPPARISVSVQSAPAAPGAPVAQPAPDHEGAELLTRYAALTGEQAIRFYLENEREILAARQGRKLDAGAFAHLSGADRVTAVFERQFPRK